MEFSLPRLFKTGKGSPVLGGEDQLYVDNLHGANYAATARGNMYHGNVGIAGIALIVSATTGNHPTLFNPLGSGVNVSIRKLEIGYVSGNNAPTSLVWMKTENAGSSQATAGAILTFTDVAPSPALVGGADNAKARWAPAANTFTAAPAYHRSAGISLFTGVAATAVAPFPLMVEYDGDFVIAPGNAVSLCSVAATTTSLLEVTVTWEEVAL